MDETEASNVEIVHTSDENEAPNQDSIETVQNENEFNEIKADVDGNESAQIDESDSPQIDKEDATVEEKMYDIEGNEIPDETNLEKDDVESQVTDDQEDTIVNNDNYDANNDSAYDTNSHRGSNSRLQSADTNQDDVDNETGENFLSQSQTQNEPEVEIIELNEIDSRSVAMENFEIERLDNELENPPTPSDDDNDVILSVGNATETGDSTLIEIANNDDYEEVHELLKLLFNLTTYCIV